MKTIVFFASKSVSPQASCEDRAVGIGRAIRAHGYTLQVVDCSDPQFSLRAALDFWRPSGVVVGTGYGLEGVRVSGLRGVPSVFFDERNGCKGPSFYLELDCVQVGRTAARFLHDLGLTQVAYVASSRGECWCRERRKAFVASCPKGGVCRVFDSVRGESSLLRRRRLEKWLLRLPRPCGVFAANDIVGEEVLIAARRLKLSVPGDLAVLGVDDLESICENTIPTLSSIAVDFQAAAFRAGEILLEIIDGVRAPVGHETYVAEKVVRRESTRRWSQGDVRIAKAVEYIRREARSGAGVDEVAGVMGLKRRQAEVLFRQVLGHTIADALLERRMELAKAELRNPRQQVSAIAALCGWKSETTLRRAFRKVTGMSLRAWRKQACRI